MCHAIILTALLSGMTVGAAFTEVLPPAAPISAKEDLTEASKRDNRILIRMGSTTLTASSLHFSEPEQARSNQEAERKNSGILVLNGEACCSIGQGDVVIVANKLQIEMHGSEFKSIAGLGNCEYVDEEGEGLRVAADKVLLGKSGLSFEGHVKLVSPKGTSVTADAIRTSSDGSGEIQIHSSGTATLTLDD